MEYRQTLAGLIESKVVCRQFMVSAGEMVNRPASVTKRRAGGKPSSPNAIFLK